MALQCNSLFSPNVKESPKTKPTSPKFSPEAFTVVSEDKKSEKHVVGSISSVDLKNKTSSSIKLTYLEVNAWLWGVDGVNILIDPLLVGNLDFGYPMLVDAAKKVVNSFQLKDLPELDLILITQSLDDHCHKKTLMALSEVCPDLQVIATPNAKSILNPIFCDVTYLEHGQSSEVEGKNGSKVTVRASVGALTGLPWRRRENGYFVMAHESQLTLYIEPHCKYNPSFLQNERADIIITPVVKLSVPLLELVSGQEAAVRLAKLLQAKVIVPMNSGDLDGRGLLWDMVHSEGTVESFKELLARELPDVQVLEPTPGVPLELPASLTSGIHCLVE